MIFFIPRFRFCDAFFYLLIKNNQSVYIYLILGTVRYSNDDLTRHKILWLSRSPFTGGNQSVYKCSFLYLRMSLRGAGLSLRDYVNDTFNRTCELVSVGLHPEPVISFEEWRARKRQASTTQGICLLSAELDSTGELQEPLVPLAADTFRSLCRRRHRRS